MGKFSCHSAAQTHTLANMEVLALSLSINFDHRGSVSDDQLWRGGELTSEKISCLPPYPRVWSSDWHLGVDVSAMRLISPVAPCQLGVICDPIVA